MKTFQPTLKSLSGFLILGFALTLLNSACKKKTDDPVDQPKTLNKAFLYDKYWYSKGNLISHHFASNGKYYNNVGTWKWLNNSDTMEIKLSSGSTQLWHFEWSTEHEFSAHLNGKVANDLFKDQKW